MLISLMESAFLLWFASNFIWVYLFIKLNKNNFFAYILNYILFIF